MEHCKCIAINRHLPPPTFKAWVKDNEDRIEKAATAGTLPYFIRDNQELVENGRVIKNPLSERLKKRRKEIRRLASESLLQQQFILPHIGVSATISNRGIKEWLNQPFIGIEEKNEALLNIKNILETSVYCGSGIDKHFQEVKVHLFETNIAGRNCWIVVRQNYTGEYLVYSVSDNEAILKAIQ